MNFFRLAPHDQSINYLGQIFGSMDGIIPIAGGSGGR